MMYTTTQKWMMEELASLGRDLTLCSEVLGERKWDKDSRKLLSETLKTLKSIGDSMMVVHSNLQP